MLYAVTPGAHWNCDLVKLGMHQSSSHELAVKELRARYITSYPAVQLLQLAFVASPKRQAEAQMQIALQQFHVEQECYSGMKRGFLGALDTFFAEVSVPIQDAHEERLSEAKRLLLESAFDKRLAHEKRKTAKRNREVEKQVAAATYKQREAAALLVRKKRSEKVLNDQAARLGKRAERSSQPLAVKWFQSHVQTGGDSEYVTQKMAASVYRRVAGSTLSVCEIKEAIAVVMAAKGVYLHNVKWHHEEKRNVCSVYFGVKLDVSV